MSDVARLDLTASEEHVAVARAFVAGALRTLGSSEADVNALRLAVSEVVSAYVRDGRDRVVVGVPAAGTVEIGDGGAPPSLDPAARNVSAGVADLARSTSGWRLSVGGA